MKLQQNENVLVITDSEEISLICDRNKIKSFRESGLKFTSENIFRSVSSIIRNKQQSNVLLYRANTPLVGSEILNSAYSYFLQNTKYIITSVKSEKESYYS